MKPSGRPLSVPLKIVDVLSPPAVKSRARSMLVPVTTAGDPLQVAPKPLVSIVETPDANVAFTVVASADSITLIVPPPRLN